MSTIEQEQQRDPLEGKVESADQPKADPRELAEARGDVHRLLDQFQELGLAGDKAINEYRQAADADPTVDGLRGFKDWIQGRLDTGRGHLQAVESDLQKAMDEKIVSKKDLVSIREKVVFPERKDFIDSAEGVKKEVQAALAARREDRKAFDRIVSHPAAAKGVLVDNEGEELEIPSLENYLLLSVENRKKFLSEAARVLSSIETAEGESAPLRTVRLALNKAKAEKVLGRIVDDKWMEEFKSLKPVEQKKCLADLDRRIADHRRFWGEARETLQPSDTRALESKADGMGLAELRKEFSDRRDRESAKLESDFGAALKAKVQERILPVSDMEKRRVDFGKADLRGRRRMSDKLALDLRPAHELRQRVDKLSDPDSKQKMEALYRDPKSDLDSIRIALEKLAAEESKIKKPSSEADKILRRVDSRRQKVRESVVETAAKLDETKKRSLVNRLGGFLFGKKEADYGNMADHVREARREQSKAKMEDAGAAQSQTRTRADRHLEEIGYSKAGGDHGRVVKLDIRDVRAVEGFASQDPLNAKKDKVALVTGIHEKDKELNFKEARVLVDYLKEDLKNPKKKGQAEKEKTAV